VILGNKEFNQASHGRQEERFDCLSEVPTWHISANRFQK
jgi:hypothetical protein